MEIVPKRKWQYPKAIEREYAKYLVAYVQKEMEIVEAFLPEIGEAVYRNSIRTDAIGDWLGNLVDKVQRAVKQKLSVLPVLNKIFKQVNQHVNTQMVETTESVFGSRPRQFNNTRQFETIKTIWTSQNTTLIKSIDQQILDKLRYSMTQRIIRTADKEQTIAALAKDIQEIARVSENRAVLIATDQVGKLNSQLTHYRQFNAGITEYVWNTMKDSRVRPAHASREGKKFKWSEPPSDGHPGWAIRCRCTALPVFDTDKMSVEPRKNTFLNLTESDIIGSSNTLGEAKKRDRKIPITEVAIQKVRKVSVPGFTDTQNTNLQWEHKKLLEYALRQNKSNEVMGITSLKFDGVLYGKGTEELVGLTPQMESYRWHLPSMAGIVIHNHPKGKSFSFMDIGYFVNRPQIGVMTAVSNQGNVHILCKQKDFSHSKCLEYIKQLHEKHGDDFEVITKEFLKNSEKVGISYVRG